MIWYACIYYVNLRNLSGKLARTWSRIEELLHATRVGYLTSCLKLKRVQYLWYSFVNESRFLLLLKYLSKTFPFSKRLMLKLPRKEISWWLVLSLDRFSKMSRNLDWFGSLLIILIAIDFVCGIKILIVIFSLSFDRKEFNL